MSIYPHPVPVEGSPPKVYCLFDRSHSHLNPTRVSAMLGSHRGHRRTYTANVPALTGIALNKVGQIPFQNPLKPSPR